MRIAIFTDDYLPNINGVITSINNFKHAFEHMGHTVYVVAPAEPDYVDTEPNVIRMRSYNPRVLKYKGRIAWLYPGLAKKLCTYKFDIVHSQTQFSMGLLANEVAKRLDVPHLNTMHTIYAELLDQYPLAVYSSTAVLSVIYPLYFRSLPKVDRQLLSSMQKPQSLVKEQIWRAGNIFLNKTDGVISPSAHLAQTLKANGLQAPCYFVPNGIDTAATRKKGMAPLPPLPFKKKRGDLWLVNVGRLSREKRQDVLVKAMAKVKSDHVKLLLIGDGPFREELEELTRSLKLIDRVYFVGSQTPDAVAAILARADMFALASYKFDNQPMVVLEALTFSLPIVYCDRRLTEGLTPKNALLTATPQPASFARAIDQLARDTKRRTTMRRAALKLSAEFDVNVLARRLLRIYRAQITHKSEIVEVKAKIEEAEPV